MSPVPSTSFSAIVVSVFGIVIAVTAAVTAEMVLTRLTVATESSCATVATMFTVYHCTFCVAVKDIA